MPDVTPATPGQAACDSIAPVITDGQWLTCREDGTMDLRDELLATRRVVRAAWDSLAAENASLRQQITDLQHGAGAWLRDTVERETAALDAHREDAKAARGHLKIVTEDRDRLTAELAAARTGNDGYRERLRQAEADYADVRKAADTYRDGLAQAARERDEARAALDNAEDWRVHVAEDRRAELADRDRYRQALNYILRTSTDIGSRQDARRALAGEEQPWALEGQPSATGYGPDADALADEVRRDNAKDAEIASLRAEIGRLTVTRDGQATSLAGTIADRDRYRAALEEIRDHHQLGNSVATAAQVAREALEGGNDDNR